MKVRGQCFLSISSGNQTQDTGLAWQMCSCLLSYFAVPIFNICIIIWIYLAMTSAWVAIVCSVHFKLESLSIRLEFSGSGAEFVSLINNSLKMYNLPNLDFLYLTSSIVGLNLARVAAHWPAREKSLAEKFRGQGCIFLSRKERHESRPLFSISSTRRSR